MQPLKKMYNMHNCLDAHASRVISLFEPPRSYFGTVARLVPRIHFANHVADGPTLDDVAVLAALLERLHDLDGAGGERKRHRRREQ